MNLTKALDNYFAAQNKIEQDFVEDFSKVILALKSNAKTFKFKGTQEYDDEGGTNTHFSRLSIDDNDLEEIVSELSKEQLENGFGESIGKLSDEDFEDKDYLWDCVRDAMWSLPDFVYQLSTAKIKP